MARKQKLAQSFSLCVLAWFCGASAHAASISKTYTGSLTSESGASGSVVLEQFTLASPSNITIYTTSYGGGKNLNGTNTLAGGFEPDITLYNSSGVVVDDQSASFSPLGKTDPKTGLNLDGYLQDLDAAAGTYYVTLTDWQNQMSITSSGLNLSEAAYKQFSGPGGTSFQDIDGNTRNGSYALDLSIAALSSSSVPEPSSLLLVIPALAGFALFRRKRARNVA